MLPEIGQAAARLPLLWMRRLSWKTSTPWMARLTLETRSFCLFFSMK